MDVVRDVTDDWALLRAYARDRSHEPFARLSAKYSPMVFATALRRTRRRDLAEDVTQAVFIVLARRAGELRRTGSLGAWLHRTALLASSEALRAVRGCIARHCWRPRKRCVPSSAVASTSGELRRIFP